MIIVITINCICIFRCNLIGFNLKANYVEYCSLTSFPTTSTPNDRSSIASRFGTPDANTNVTFGGRNRCGCNRAVAI
jgi:hypothetical protein